MSKAQPDLAREHGCSKRTLAGAMDGEGQRPICGVPSDPESEMREKRVEDEQRSAPAFRQRRAAWWGRRPLVLFAKESGSFQSHSPQPEGRAKPCRGRSTRVPCGEAAPHQGLNRWLGNSARVCRRGTDDFLRCNALRLLHPTVLHCMAKPRHHIKVANV